MNKLISGRVSSGLRVLRQLNIIRCFRSTLPAASSSLSDGELSNLQDALKQNRYKSKIQLYKPSSTTSSKTRSIVLFAGWAESTLRVLQKYASIYTEHFNIPCLAIAPPIQMVWFTKLAHSFADSVVQALNKSIDDGDTPVSLILHLCSSGGQVLLPRLLEETEHANSLLNTKIRQQCLIFDSGPVNFVFNSGMGAAKQLYRYGGLNVFTYPLYTAFGISVNYLIGSRKRQELKDILESQLMNVPQLYLYSKIDPVAPYEWVEEVMKGQQQRGRDVHSHCWDDSEHVQHFRQHTQEYIELIRKFMSECNLI